MAISLVKKPTGNPSFNLLKKPPRQRKFNIGIDEPPGGLVPLGDSGFWTTPEEPADPRDCERWEGSPYCTPWFFTLTPVSLEPAIVIDECNIGIRLDGSLGFYRVPPIAIVYRDPSDACKPPLPPEPPPTSGGSSKPGVNNCSIHSQVLVVVTGTATLTTSILAHDIGGKLYSGNGYVEESTYITGLIKISPDNDYSFYTVGGEYRTDVIAIGTYNYSSTFNYDDGYKLYYNNFREGNVSTFSDSGVFYLASDGSHNIQRTGVTEFKAVTFVLSSQEVQHFNVRHKHYTTLLDEVYKGELNPIGFITGTQVPHFVQICLGNEDFHSNPPPPPEYSPPPRRCCMSCCPNQGEPDNSLLNLLIKKVDKLSNIVGVDDYPVKLPESLISKDEGFFGNLIPNATVDVPSLTRLAAWYIERFDEIMGQWEIPIEIKDSDPSTQGEQPVGIKLPNVAECLAEMFTLCFQTNINTETLLNMGTRTLGETAADKQQNFVTYKLLQSLTDWVGYKQKDTKQKMPLTFTPGKTRYDEILQECEVDVPVPEFDEKFGLEADLMRFREAVSILQANNKIKIDPNGNVKAQILKYLLDSFKNMKKVNGDDVEQDFEDFLEQVEQGFINTRGITDNINPYGRPPNVRPRVRDLTNFETDNPKP